MTREEASRFFSIDSVKNWKPKIEIASGDSFLDGERVILDAIVMVTWDKVIYRLTHGKNLVGTHDEFREAYQQLRDKMGLD